MTTKKQKDANKRNAQKSTGPKTAAGKNSSKLNALVHGLTAKNAVVIQGEDPEAFEAMRQDLFYDAAPQGVLEALILDRIANILWRLRRVPQIEASLFEALQREAVHDVAKLAVRWCESDRERVRHNFKDDCELKHHSTSDDTDRPDMAALDALYREKRVELDKAHEQRLAPEAMLGQAFRKSLSEMEALDKLSRYDRELVRQLETALDELERVKRMYPPSDDTNILELTAEHDED